jgi:hypothetical protein
MADVIDLRKTMSDCLDLSRDVEDQTLIELIETLIADLTSEADRTLGPLEGRLRAAS